MTSTSCQLPKPIRDNPPLLQCFSHSGPGIPCLVLGTFARARPLLPQTCLSHSRPTHWHPLQETVTPESVIIFLNVLFGRFDRWGRGKNGDTCACAFPICRLMSRWCVFSHQVMHLACWCMPGALLNADSVLSALHAILVPTANTLVCISQMSGPT